MTKFAEVLHTEEKLWISEQYKNTLIIFLTPIIFSFILNLCYKF